MSHGDRRLSGRGWCVLVLLFLSILFASKGMFIFGLLILCGWIWTRYKRTGRMPNPVRMIEEWFVGDGDDRSGSPP